MVHSWYGSIRGFHASRGGNKALKRMLFLSVFASIKGDASSRVYYDRRRAEGKRHNQVRGGVGS